ncbi:MAG: sugar transferase [Cyanobacteria bacterium SBLK]|nr:sugar transferase [Cyanobacteria bacterium SBLK]
MIVSSFNIEGHHPSVGSTGKRLLDIIGALVGLSILAVLFLPIAIAIKLESRGSIFFRQTRCGLYGRRFAIWKFRSMVADASILKEHGKGYGCKDAEDPRITAIGRWLRRTSLDEFPQFWNVLRGEMSLVGTRPPIPEEVALYSPLHWHRLRVKPGLTGEWQVNGRSRVKDFDRVVALDLRYQRRWSLGYDCWLLLKTLYVVLAQVGAY